MKRGMVYIKDVFCGIITGVPANVAEKCLAKMTGHKDKWFETIDNSFLPDDLKDRYKELIQARLSLL